MSNQGMSDKVKQSAMRAAGPSAPATSIVGHERKYLYACGWRERSCAGPWRFYRPDWKPIAWYTLHDAVALQRSMDKRTR